MPAVSGQPLKQSRMIRADAHRPVEKVPDLWLFADIAVHGQPECPSYQQLRKYRNTFRIGIPDEARQDTEPCSGSNDSVLRVDAAGFDICLQAAVDLVQVIEFGGR